MSSRNARDGGRERRGVEEDDEVKTLMRAAEDELLLNLSINSHAARGTSHSYLDPNLHRRFQALRSHKPPPPRQHHLPVNGASGSADDLFARFAALKGSVTPSSSSSIVGNSEMDDDDEVDKVMRWAVDAARLDPSPPQSDYNDDVDSSSASTTDDDEEEDHHNKRVKEPIKKNNP